MDGTDSIFLRAVRQRFDGSAPVPPIFAKFTRSENGEELSLLLETVDLSDYSLADWIEALVTFDHWLEAKGEGRRPLREMVGYIHCCTAANPAQITLPKLEVIVYQALTKYGFDALSDAQI